jgi:CYTH domain-containing protein
MPPNNLEIERKFLISLQTTPFIFIDNYKNYKIEQAYLVEGELEIRIRSITHNSKKNLIFFYMTVKKSVSKLTRKEIEFEISEEIFKELWSLSDIKVKKIRTKIRTSIKEQPAYWEIDQYSNGLVLMEIELPSEDTILPPFPNGITVIKEVTGDSLYRNSFLAKTIIYDESTSL